MLPAAVLLPLGCMVLVALTGSGQHLGQHLAVGVVMGGALAGWTWRVASRLDTQYAEQARQLEERLLRLEVRDARRGRLNAQLQRRLRACEGELAQFAYVASHDLRAPLRRIRSFVRLLEKHGVGKTDAVAGEWLDFTVASVEQGETLVQQLTQFSRVAGQVPTLQRFGLGVALEDARAGLHERIEGFAMRLQAGPLPEVEADRRALTEVFKQLLDNAWRYRRGDRSLIVEVQAIDEAGEVRVEVRDNGRGLLPHDIERVFELFQRGGNARDTDGAGLGLALARRIIHRHGGVMGALPPKSGDDGATIWFSLPLSASSIE